MEIVIKIAGEKPEWAECEIVRCRNCNNYYEADNYHPQGNYTSHCCRYFGTYSNEVTPNGFCAWGVKRDTQE